VEVAGRQIASVLVQCHFWWKLARCDQDTLRASEGEYCFSTGTNDLPAKDLDISAKAKQQPAEQTSGVMQSQSMEGPGNSGVNAQSFELVIARPEVVTSTRQCSYQSMISSEELLSSQTLLNFIQDYSNEVKWVL